ncbi:hypothetical protein BD779DRAFT_1466588 [Infundibulicybe gibba]|nr:hypothetical protein BD779DRAFT_1466588 [Infundibulicybe gibba]
MPAPCHRLRADADLFRAQDSVPGIYITFASTKTAAWRKKKEYWWVLVQACRQAGKHYAWNCNNDLKEGDEYLEARRCVGRPIIDAHCTHTASQSDLAGLIWGRGGSSALTIARWHIPTCNCTTLTMRGDASTAEAWAAWASHQRDEKLALRVEKKLSAPIRCLN